MPAADRGDQFEAVLLLDHDAGDHQVLMGGVGEGEPLDAVVADGDLESQGKEFLLEMEPVRRGILDEQKASGHRGTDGA